MTMAAFPCPPLPMVGSDRFGHERVVNSHDLLSFLMTTAARRDISSENAVRQDAQQRLLDEYNQPSSTDTWARMTRFTRDYMLTYCPTMHYPLFLPFDAATSPIKAQVASWLAAQHILNGNDANANEFKDIPYDLLYSRCAVVVREPRPIYDSPVACANDLQAEEK